MAIQWTEFFLKSTVNSHLAALNILQALNSPMNWIWDELSGKQEPNRRVVSVIWNLLRFEALSNPNEHWCALKET